MNDSSHSDWNRIPDGWENIWILDEKVLWFWDKLRQMFHACGSCWLFSFSFFSLCTLCHYHLVALRSESFFTRQSGPKLVRRVFFLLFWTILHHSRGFRSIDSKRQDVSLVLEFVCSVFLHVLSPSCRHFDPSFYYVWPPTNPMRWRSCGTKQAEVAPSCWYYSFFVSLQNSPLLLIQHFPVSSNEGNQMLLHCVFFFGEY